MRPCRIAPGYKARVGKDTLCNFVAENRPNVIVVRIAKPVYEMAFWIKQTIALDNEQQSKSCKYTSALNVSIGEAIYLFIQSKFDEAKMSEYTCNSTTFQFKEKIQDQIDSLSTTVVKFLDDPKIKKQICNPDDDKRLINMEGCNDPDFMFKVTKCPSLLILIGEGFRKIFYPEIWDDIVEKEVIKPALEKDKDANFVCPDPRHFTNHALLKRYGFIIGKVIKDEREIDRDPNSSSETELDEVPDSYWDFIIHNNSDLMEYKMKVVDLLIKFDM
jgi:hypothetical protein